MTIILVMFLLTQFIGLYVVNSYASQKVVDGQMVNNTGKILPYGMGIQEEDQNFDLTSTLFSLLFSILIFFKPKRWAVAKAILII